MIQITLVGMKRARMKMKKWEMGVMGMFLYLTPCLSIIVESLLYHYVPCLRITLMFVFSVHSVVTQSYDSESSYSDSDDTSWKIRRMCAKLVFAIAGARYISHLVALCDFAF